MFTPSLVLITIATGLCTVTAPVHGQNRPKPIPESASIAAAAVTDRAMVAMPSVGKYYTVRFGDVPGPRVKFEQTDDTLVAVWMTTEGDVYGRGTYQWDAAQGVFVGTAMSFFTCPSTETSKPYTFQHSVREQLRVLNDRELLNRWTKPLDVDCSIGIVQKFKWIERLWVAADENWNPLK